MRIRRIAYTIHFLRALRSLPSSTTELVREREHIFKADCFDQRLKTHKLRGKLKGFWSFSLTHADRVLFQFLEPESVVFVDVGSHSIYK